MKYRLYSTTTVAVAMVVIVIATATLSALSYKYTVGSGGALEDTIVQQITKLVDRTIENIEQEIIANDRALYEIADVNDPARWPDIDREIKKADLNVDQVWFLNPRTGEILYPRPHQGINDLYRAFTRSFNLKELNLPNRRLDETNHLHKERREGYFFASWVLKQNRKGERVLVCFQMNLDRVQKLVVNSLQDLRSSHYVSVVDYENNAVVFGPLQQKERYFYERRFESTLYKWLLQAIPRKYTEIEQNTRNSRRIIFLTIFLSVCLVFSSVVIIYVASRRERQLTQLKEDFISNVSHELKTPLSLIGMFSEILVLGKVKNPEAKEEYYRIIHNESDRMSRLINNLLDFSTLERGVLREHFEPTNIGQLVTKEMEAYRYEIHKDGFQLTTNIDPTVPDTLADPNALTMALFNLLDNSVKYSGDVKDITVSVSQSNGYVDLTVSDRGLGISAAEHQRIFEKFYRGTSAAVRRVRGSGIGLSLTKHVAELHGGEVLLESEPGKGSTFTLRIPVRTKPQLEKTAAAS